MTGYMGTKYIKPEKIEEIADKIRSDLLPEYDSDVFYEVDIYTIAKKLGCKIELVNFDPPNVSARVLRNVENDSFTIQISRSDSVQRRKFSIAHEIAHIVLHDDGEDEFIEFRKNQIEYDPESLYKEVQANMLASALLLPKEPVTIAWESSNSIDMVAEQFSVSKEAAYNRLSNLGLLDNE